MADQEKEGPNWVNHLPPTTDLVIGTERGVLVRIKSDGALEYGPEYQPDDAARVFWEALAEKRREHEEQQHESRLIAQHVEALVARLGAADLYCERMRVEAVNLAGSGREGSVVLEAQRATTVLERINHQVIELGRGLAQRADVEFLDVPKEVPRRVATSSESAYEPGEMPGDHEIGPRRPGKVLN